MPAPNMFDAYGVLGGSGGPTNVGQGGLISGSPNPPILMPQMSASCPNTMQDELGRMPGMPPLNNNILLTPSILSPSLSLSHRSSYGCKVS